MISLMVSVVHAERLKIANENAFFKSQNIIHKRGS